jgi:hypothetical protein
MKFFAFLFFASLFVNQYTSAQHRASFGIKGGGGLSTFDYRKNSNNYGVVYKWTPSFYVGFTANAPFGKFFIQPELLYSLRGHRYEGYSDGTRYGYISMPLLIGFRPVKQLGILLGPEFGYIISARSQYTINGPGNIIKSVSHRNTIDIDGGFSWSATSKLTVEGRYVYGIKPLYDKYIYGPSGANGMEEDGFNEVIQLGVSYRLR